MADRIPWEVIVKKTGRQSYLRAARGVFGMVARARTFLRAAIHLVPVSKRQRMAEIVVIFSRRGVQNGSESVIRCGTRAYQDEISAGFEVDTSLEYRNNAYPPYALRLSYYLTRLLDYCCFILFYLFVCIFVSSFVFDKSLF